MMAGDTFINGGIAAQKHISDPSQSATADTVTPALNAIWAPVPLDDATAATLALQARATQRDQDARAGEHPSAHNEPTALPELQPRNGGR